MQLSLRRPAGIAAALGAVIVLFAAAVLAGRAIAPTQTVVAAEPAPVAFRPSTPVIPAITSVQSSVSLPALRKPKPKPAAAKKTPSSASTSTPANTSTPAVLPSAPAVSPTPAPVVPAPSPSGGGGGGGGGVIISK